MVSYATIVRMEELGALPKGTVAKVDKIMEEQRVKHVPWEAHYLLPTYSTLCLKLIEALSQKNTPPI